MSLLDGTQRRNCSLVRARKRVSYNLRKISFCLAVTSNESLSSKFFVAADPNSILVRHKKFLKQLERQKNVERDENREIQAEKENKTAKFREAAARQREKIKGLK